MNVNLYANSNKCIEIKEHSLYFIEIWSEKHCKNTLAYKFFDGQTKLPVFSLRWHNCTGHVQNLELKDVRVERILTFPNQYQML